MNHGPIGNSSWWSPDATEVPMWRDALRRPPKTIANFDSATAMMRATANYLDGRDFPALGLSPLLKVPAARANLLPSPLRRLLYHFSGWNESIPADSLADVDVENLSRWVAREYPEREYPALAIGASNGAGVHLCCAMGMPWLPQTFLIPVRQPVDPDEPKEAMEVGKDPGRALLDANPDIQLHHMHDANQDRIMVQTMTYFRVKRRRLGEAYERFIEERLPPGSTIYVFDCRRTWPTTTIGDRYVFQHGALGGATEEEFLHGSERVEAYLEREESHRRRWDPPAPDGRSPEAEWGFEPSLLDEVRRVAARHGHRVRRIVYTEPEHLSPFVAELYRWWYARRGIDAARLIIEQFIVMDPWWTLRTGSVPLWLEFNMERSLRTAEEYLDQAEAYRDIRMMLFNHGVEAVGLPSVDDWAGLFDHALHHSGWLGTDPSEFPMDYAQFARYHTEIRKIPERHLMPHALGEDRLDQFVAESGDRFAVQLVDDTITR